MANKDKSKKRVILRYFMNEAHMASWVEGYEGIRVEGRGKASRALTLIQDHLRREFPSSTIPNQEFEFSLSKDAGSFHMPIREHICLVVDQVALITGLSRMTSFSWERKTPDDFTAPTCIIDAVAGIYTSKLSEQLCRAYSTQNDRSITLVGIIDEALDNARVETVCAAVDALDGITPGCDRELIQFMIRPRVENGPPDPFSSKSRFRNSLMEALIWFSISKKDYPNKTAGKVTMDDLAYYFCQLGYIGKTDQDAPHNSTDKGPEVDDTGGNDRTIRRWMQKYTNPKYNWPALRSDLISTIRRTGYDLF